MSSETSWLYLGFNLFPAQNVTFRAIMAVTVSKLVRVERSVQNYSADCGSLRRHRMGRQPSWIPLNLDSSHYTLLQFNYVTSCRG